MVNDNPKTYNYHLPVMVDEVCSLLLWNSGGIYVDATLGGGGHTRAMLDRLDSSATVIGLDVDEDAIQYANENLSAYNNKRIIRMGYDQIEFVLEKEGISAVDGILYDLGISSRQVDSDEKGFTFMGDGPLDMRFDQRQLLTAATVVNEYPVEDLYRIIKDFGEEKFARRIAHKIDQLRSISPFRTTGQLSDAVRQVVAGKFATKSIARVFQAIRIEVNKELEKLLMSLETVIKYLNVGGRIAVISYHSLEDRIVKNFFKEKSQHCICPPEFPVCRCNHVQELEIITKKPILPGEKEMENNSRARSAKLRVAAKV